MRLKICHIVLSTALGIGTLPVAGMAAKNPAARAEKQELKKRVKSGQLTPEQAQEIKAQLKALRAEVKAAKKNGKISPEDRARFKAERKQLRDELQSKPDGKQ